jgi:hypothetical protein
VWKAGRVRPAPLTAVTPQDQEASKSNSARISLTIASKRLRREFITLLGGGRLRGRSRHGRSR